MILNRVKVGLGVTFMKYLPSVVYLIFLPESLTWKKITFSELNSLILAELVVNELMKSISKKKKLPIFLFLSHLSQLNVNILRT